MKETHENPSSPSAGAPGSESLNAHIIVGEPRRCVCGVYGGTPIGCREVLASLDELVRQANIRGSGPSLYAHDILRLEAVIRPLVQDCNDIPNTKLSGGGPLSNETTEAESRRPLE